MTFSNLQKLIKDNNIPESVRLLSDSGWECDETEMDGVWYCEESNVIIFTQGSDINIYKYRGNKCKCLYMRCNIMSTNLCEMCELKDTQVCSKSYKKGEDR